MADEQAVVKDEKKDVKDKPQKNKTKSPKRRNYKKELQEVTKEFEALQDQHLRTRAEFENYKKRRDKEVASFLENANRNLIESLLPVIDDFDRSFNANQEDKSREDPFYQGIDLIYQKIKAILEQAGVEMIDSIGKPFDPQLHEALMQMESKDHDPGIVLDEVVKGYKLNNKVLRYAKVVVSK